MSIKRLYISKGVMTLALSGVALISVMGNNEKSKCQENTPLPIQIKEWNSIQTEIDNTKQIEIYSNEKMKEIEKKGKIDFIPFDHMRKLEEDLEYIKSR